MAEIVPRDKLSNAVTLNSVEINVARVLGAALGGGLVTVKEMAICFALNSLSFVAVLITLVMMRKAELHPAPKASKETGQVRAGLRYAWTTPELMVPLAMITVIGTLAYEFPVSLPLVAVDTFHRGAGVYGLMAAVMAGGAVLGGPPPCRSNWSLWSSLATGPSPSTPWPSRRFSWLRDQSCADA